LNRARECIERSLAIVDKFEILVAAWQVHATAWHLLLLVKENERAEVQRKGAESCILRIADSFSPEEPLRATFLAAVPIRRILSKHGVSNATLQHK